MKQHLQQIANNLGESNMHYLQDGTWVIDIEGTPVHTKEIPSTLLAIRTYLCTKGWSWQQTKNTFILVNHELKISTGDSTEYSFSCGNMAEELLALAKCLYKATHLHNTYSRNQTMVIKNPKKQPHDERGWEPQ